MINVLTARAAGWVESRAVSVSSSYTLTRLMPSGHLARQLRFVLPGAAITYWLQTPSLLAQIWSDADATPLARFVFLFPFPPANNFRDPRSLVLCRPLVGASALSGLLTVALFLYILLIPMIKGIPPNVRLAMSLRPLPMGHVARVEMATATDYFFFSLILTLVSVVERVR